MNPAPQNPILYHLLSAHYLDLPHARALDLHYQGLENLRATVYIDWQAHLTGHTQRQSLHGGVLTTLIDTASACAVAARLESPEHLATLDMRIDHLHPPTHGQRLYCSAECYRFAGQVAFVRSTCYHQTPEEPIALGTATFMRTPISAEEQARLQTFLQAQTTP